MTSDSRFHRIPTEHIEKIKARATRYFNNHRVSFLEASIDCDDVIQECLIRAWLICEKHPECNEEELLKTVHKSIGHRLIRLCKRAEKKNKLCQLDDFDAILHHVDEDNYDEKCFLEKDIEEAKKLLDKDQLKVIELIVEDDLSFDQASSILNMSKRGVVYRYQQAMSIIEQHLK